MEVAMNNEKRVELRIDEEVAEGTYVNGGNIIYSQAEFIIDFTRIVPPPGKPRVMSRIIMNPMQAKGFLESVKANIARYEEQYGEIPTASGKEKKVGFNQ